MVVSASGPQFQPALATGDVVVIGQYCKDLAFERREPLGAGADGRQIDVEVDADVVTRQLSEREYEVSLLLAVKAAASGSPVFELDIDYAAAVHIPTGAAVDRDAVLKVTCPELLYPFAAKVIDRAIRRGGYPSMRFPTLDFEAMRRRAAAG